jgi:POT family proton-dependent oligopeptide transporter
MMAIWFLSSSWAQYLGGFIAAMAGTETVGGQVLDPAAALRTSLSVFEIIGWVGVASGLVFLALSPVLRRWAHGADDTVPEPQAEAPGVRSS